MNGIESGVELVQMRHLTHFSTPPISIYILNPYKFIGADEMILEEKTFKEFGYYPSELSPYSHKPVLAACDDCGKVREIRVIHYAPRCKKCANERKGDIWKKYGTMQGENNPNYGKNQFPQLNDREWAYNQYHVLEKSSCAIAKSVGCCPLTVLNALRGKNICVRTISENTRGKNNPNYGKHRYPELEDKGWLISKYWVEYKSSIGIAEIIGCSVGSVLDALVNLNIPRRGYSDYYGELHHSYGKTLSEETRLLISEHHVDVSGENHPLFGKHHSEEVKKKMGESHIGLHAGEKNPNWKGGISFEPYCIKFNNALKEEIRDKFGRKCFLCPKTEEENGRKLDVHHVDYNKEQGCNGVRWLLVPLCISCNTIANFNREYWQDFITEKLRQEGYI